VPWEGEDAVVVFVAEEIGVRRGEFDADAGGHRPSNQVKHKANDKVLNRNDFVVGAEAKEIFPVAFGMFRLW
jgi:hypothetical protein